MITDVAGVRVGHVTDAVGRTGCTVALFPEGTVASGEVRGGAPATREVALLDPTRTVDRLDALVLTGGSAFGLAAADGAMRYCEEQGAGVPTVAGPVPIVVALGIYDLAVGDPAARPGAADGYAACRAATGGPIETGAVGVGTGATVGGVAGVDRRPGGLVTASVTVADLTVAALVAVNALGVPRGDDASAVTAAAAALDTATDPTGTRPSAALFGNTTVGVVVTNARLDKLACHLVAQGAHDGLARAVFPAHTRADGDAFVAASVAGGSPTGGSPSEGGGDGVVVDVDVVRSLAVHVVARAIGSLAEPH